MKFDRPVIIKIGVVGQIGPNYQILLTPGNKGGGYCRVCVLIKCSGYIAQKLSVLVSDTTQEQFCSIWEQQQRNTPACVTSYTTKHRTLKLEGHRSMHKTNNKTGASRSLDLLPGDG